MRPLNAGHRPSPADITAEMRAGAELAIDAARREAHAEQSDRWTQIVEPLADAISRAADLLDQQQRFLIELRNWKADA